MASKVCPNCKGINESYAEACFRCGEIFLCEPDPEENTADAALKKCPNCEAANVGYAETCFRCGATIVDEPSPEENAAEDAVIHYKKCVKCKATADMKYDDCPKCGGKLQVFSKPYIAPNGRALKVQISGEERAKKKEALKYIAGEVPKLIVWIVLIIIWIMGMIYYSTIIDSTIG